MSLVVILLVGTEIALDIVMFTFINNVVVNKKSAWPHTAKQIFVITTYLKSLEELLTRVQISVSPSIIK